MYPSLPRSPSSPLMILTDFFGTHVWSTSFRPWPVHLHLMVLHVHWRPLSRCGIGLSSKPSLQTIKHSSPSTQSTPGVHVPPPTAWHFRLLCRSLYSSGTAGQVAEQDGKASASSFKVSQTPLLHFIFLPEISMAAFLIPNPSEHPRIHTLRPSGQCHDPFSTTGGSPHEFASAVLKRPTDKAIALFIFDCF